MNMHKAINGLKGCLLAQVLPLAAIAATPPPDIAPPVAANPQQQELDAQLDEILVEGRKPERNPQKVIDWMARLVGEFTWEGHVDVHARGRPEDIRAVHGSGNCTGFGLAPAVQCDIKARWSTVRGEDGEPVMGGVSNLNPAMMLYGFEPDRIGIRYMLVDSNGIADGGLGYVVDNTLISRTPCANVAGNCQRVARITADPDLKVVRMEIVLEIDYERAAYFDFIMRRVSGSQAVVVSGPKIFAEPD